MIDWEPSTSGIKLWLENPDVEEAAHEMPMTDVRELRDDMEEASFLSRGFEKVDLMAEELDRGYMVRVLGHDWEIRSLLRGREGAILDLAPVEWHEGVFEVTLPLDLQVTAYRPVD